MGTGDCDYREFEDLVEIIESGAAVVTAATGRRPTSLVVGPAAADQFRRVAAAYPGAVRADQKPHQRPASFEASDRWLGQIAGIDVYESAPEPQTEARRMEMTLCRFAAFGAGVGAFVYAAASATGAWQPSASAIVALALGALATACAFARRTW